MFVKIITIAIERKPHSKHTSKKLIICTCDQCGREYKTKYTKKELRDAQTKLTFCGIECLSISRSHGGLLWKQTQSNRDVIANQAKIEETMIRRYGVKNAGQMRDHADKCAATLKERYGVTNALNLPHARDKMREALARPETTEKRIATNIERHEHANVFSTKPVKEKIKETLKERYGVEHSSYIEGIGEKRKATYAKTHDYDHPFKNPLLRKRIRNTLLLRYGTKTFFESEVFRNVVRTSEWQQRRHESMKRNGTYGKSKFENAVYECLLSAFPNIQRCVLINGWSIDLFIPDAATYIQIDGVYWHGLDRPREVIEASSYPRDKVILSTMERDKQQNEWFTAQNIRLLRFTDKQSIDEIVEAVTQYVTSINV